MLRSRFRQRFLTVFLAAALLSGCAPSERQGSIAINYPAEGSVFPWDITAPVFRWSDESVASSWVVRFTLNEPVAVEVDAPFWQPTQAQWQAIKQASLDAPLSFAVSGLRDQTPVSEASVSISTSPDPVGAPVFFRQVPLPFSAALKNRPAIQWRLGFPSSPEEPRTVLEGLHTCANCHSFSADGAVMAMDLDYGGDKGSYAIAPIGETVGIDESRMITWKDFRGEDGHRTFGMLSQVSPNGRYVISTVKEKTIMHFLPDPYCTQLFFPLAGILAVYDRQEDRFFALLGADDPELVQTNASWSPDGEWIVFSRAEAYDFGTALPQHESVVPRNLAEPFIDGRETFGYDLYRIPFNEGRGGVAEPLEGGSGNDMSNYFARYSPDSKWIIFCGASEFMFNRPDADLFIVPAEGGEARRLSSSSPDRMDSWHSFSPNGRWLVYSSKANGPFTQLWLTHIDDDGNDSPPVLLEHFTPANRAANLPEFVNIGPEKMQEIRISLGLRGAPPG